MANLKVLTQHFTGHRKTMETSKRIASSLAEIK